MAGISTGIAARAADLCDESDHWDHSLRLVLLRGEAIRLPRSARRLRVISGRAWVSQEGEDILLSSCESLPLCGKPEDQAVVSATGDEALFFELDRGGERRIAL
jgi:hypothetical protein